MGATDKAPPSHYNTVSAVCTVDQEADSLLSVRLYVTCLTAHWQYFHYYILELLQLRLCPGSVPVLCPGSVPVLRILTLDR